MGWSGIVIISGSDTSMGCTDALGLDLGFGVWSFQAKARVNNVVIITNIAKRCHLKKSYF